MKASTYFGETGEAAEQTAGIIKDVYAEGVGRSMDAVSNAVITVKKNLQDWIKQSLRTSQSRPSHWMNCMALI